MASLPVNIDSMINIPIDNKPSYVLCLVTNKPKYKVACRYYNSKTRCKFGNNCYFQHQQFITYASINQTKLNQLLPNRLKNKFQPQSTITNHTNLETANIPQSNQQPQQCLETITTHMMKLYEALRKELTQLKSQSQSQIQKLIKTIKNDNSNTKRKHNNKYKNKYKKQKLPPKLTISTTTSTTQSNDTDNSCTLNTNNTKRNQFKRSNSAPVNKTNSKSTAKTYHQNMINSKATTMNTKQKKTNSHSINQPNESIINIDYNDWMKQHINTKQSEFNIEEFKFDTTLFSANGTPANNNTQNNNLSKNHLQKPIENPQQQQQKQNEPKTWKQKEKEEHILYEEYPTFDAHDIDNTYRDHEYDINQTRIALNKYEIELKRIELKRIELKRIDDLKQNDYDDDDQLIKELKIELITNDKKIFDDILSTPDTNCVVSINDYEQRIHLLKKLYKAFPKKKVKDIKKIFLEEQYDFENTLKKLIINFDLNDYEEGKYDEMLGLYDTETDEEATDDSSSDDDDDYDSSIEAHADPLLL